MKFVKRKKIDMRIRKKKEDTQGKKNGDVNGNQEQDRRFKR